MTTPPFGERLRQGRPLLADGAMGTELLARGLERGDCPERWCLTNPAALTEIAQAYLDAGAEIVQTNTFGGSPLKLAAYGLEGRAREINAAAVEVVRRVVGGRAYVSGSCGPSGKILEPYGEADPDEVMRGFVVQMEALVEAGVDLLCIETMIDVREAVLAVRAARSVSERVPIAATMTFERTRRGFHTVMGSSVRQAADELSAAGADVVGANCGNGIENMILIGRDFRAATAAPVLIQSNAGLPEMVDGRLRYGETPEFFADRARELALAGVAIIGGCCGTTPEHIRALRRMLDALRPPG